MLDQGWCSERERKAILLLSLVSKISFYKLSKLIQTLNVKPSQIENFTNNQLQELGWTCSQVEQLRNKKNQALVDKALLWHQPQNQQFILCPLDEKYPCLLREIGSPPLILFLKGKLALIDSPQLAIVGSRNATLNAQQLAFQFASQLSESGLTITSGMALGIDAQAHKGALGAGGSTIGVLGCGVDRVYPKRNAKLYADVIENQGLLISEFLPGTPPRPNNFPRRNRIVSGLSVGTLIIEAVIRSGSLITARRALEQNREVFAIPGNINNPNAGGCNYLIQQGAKLTTCVEDILDEIQHFIPIVKPLDSSTSKKSPNPALATDTLLDSVEFDVTSLDVITERNKLPVQDVMAALLEYELRGLVAAVPGGYIKLRGK